MARPPEELLEQLGTKDRSGDSEARARLHLVLEAADLLVEAERARIDEDPGEEAGRPRNGLSPDIPPPVQPGDQPGETDRIDVEDPRRVDIVPDPERLARGEQEVAQPERVRPEKLTLHLQQRPVAARVVQDRLEPDLRL